MKNREHTPNDVDRYKKALHKISKYAINPTSETELQRIKRLKSIADKALNIASFSKSASWENLLKQTGGKRPKGVVKGYMRH